MHAFRRLVKTPSQVLACKTLHHSIIKEGRFNAAAESPAKENRVNGSEDRYAQYQ